MFPPTLQPTDHLPLPLGGHTHHIPRCRPAFTAAPHTEGVDSFGGKDLLLVDGRPQFAEVAILRAFQQAGWEGRWLETYPYRKHPRHWLEWKPGGTRAQEHVPIAEAWVIERLLAIAQANGGYFSGCWDVVVWKNHRLVFAESKRQKKDRMRGTQLRWLEAALRCGCGVEDFLVVEWGLGS